MLKFKFKPQTVEAYQHREGQYPEPLHKYIDNGKGSWDDKTKQLNIMTPDGSRRVGHGEWVVLFDNGEFWIYGADEFQVLATVIKPPKAKK